MDKDDIFAYFRNNPEQAAVIEQAIMSDQIVAKLLTQLLNSNHTVVTALERAISSYAPARNELKQIMAHPEITALIKQKIEASPSATKAIKEAIFRDDYCKNMIFETILNSGEETLNAIDSALQKSPQALKLIDDITAK